MNRENYNQNDLHLFYLLRGTDSDHKLSNSQLAKMTRLTQRHVRKVIKMLRLDGCPIVSDLEGYWWGSKEDILCFVDNMQTAINDKVTLMSVMIGDNFTINEITSMNFNGYLPS